MSGFKRTACVLYSVVGIALLLMGLIYLFTPRFMPYHSVALQLRWEDLDDNARGMILGYLKLGAAGFLTAGGTILLLTWIPFRQGQSWANWAVPGIATLYLVVLHAAVWTVMVRTPASPPIIGIYILATMVIVAAGLTNLGGRHSMSVDEEP